MLNLLTVTYRAYRMCAFKALPFGGMENRT